MKKILLIAVILAVMCSATVLALCAVSPLFSKPVKGSDRIVTRTLDVPQFDAIDASRSVKVVITDRVSDKIKIEANDNFIDLVTVAQEDGTLKISIDNSVRGISNVDVTVTVPSDGAVCKLSASSAANITSRIPLTAARFAIEASSAGRIEAEIKASHCQIEASSAAKIKADLTATNCLIDQSSASKVSLKGRAESCSAELSSASQLSADEFAVVDFGIETSSAAKASICCTKTLRADVSSGSKVVYTGDCATDIEQSSGASVRKE